MKIDTFTGWFDAGEVHTIGAGRLAFEGEFVGCWRYRASLYSVRLDLWRGDDVRAKPIWTATNKDYIDMSLERRIGPNHCEIVRRAIQQYTGGSVWIQAADLDNEVE